MINWLKKLFERREVKKPGAIKYFEGSYCIINYELAYWMDKDKVTGTCCYTTAYYPFNHTVDLFYEGPNAKEHQFYMNCALPKFYHLQNILPNHSREEILGYIKERPITMKKDEKVAQVENPRLSNIRELEEELQYNLKIENYEVVAQIQKEIEDLEGKK